MDVVLTLILLSVGLAADAFALSVCDGLCMEGLNGKRRLFISASFGLFQGVMPLIGYFLGSLFIDYIGAFDHWVVFGLLVFLGGKMIVESIVAIKKGEDFCATYSYKTVLLQAVATSIDALVVGITLHEVKASVFVSCAVIAAITFGLSLIGISLGKTVDKLFKGKTQIACIVGGAVLIGIGTKILIEHLL